MKDYKNKISDYILGNLNELDHAAFEEALLSDADLREQLEFEQLLAYSAEKENYMDFLKEVVGDDQSLKKDISATKEIKSKIENDKSSEKIISFRSYRKWAIAASIAILLGIVGYLNLKNNSGREDYLAIKKDSTFFLAGQDEFRNTIEIDSISNDSLLKRINVLFKNPDKIKEHLELSSEYLLRSNLSEETKLSLNFDLMINAIRLDDLSNANIYYNKAFDIFSGNQDLEDQKNWKCKLSFSKCLIVLVETKDIKNMQSCLNPEDYSCEDFLNIIRRINSKH